MVLLWSLLAVTPGPGWSWPIPITEEPNTQLGATQFIAIDSSCRLHLMWKDYMCETRIGYKVFLIDGTTVVPDTMISNDTWSSYLHQMAFSGDSLFGFWRQGTAPAYYCVRSLADGSEITPVTWLLTESTQYPHIRVCADSLGRLHVLRNIGQDVYYARWTPVEPAGFTEDYCWKIEGAFVTGVILVDGDRVHVVSADPGNGTLNYVQYDVDGNTTIPLMDFTGDDHSNTRWPDLSVDSQGDLMVVDRVGVNDEYARLSLWKIDSETGEVLIEEKTLVMGYYGMQMSSEFIFVALPGNELFYLLWADSYNHKRLWFTALDSEGDLLFEPYIAYDHNDEDPELVSFPEGAVDSEGNLYVIYGQGENEPVFGQYPTFGWFDHDYLPQGIGEDAGVDETFLVLDPSCNPFSSSVTITCEGPSLPGQLMVYDITGRLIRSLSDREGSSFTWDGRDASGAEVPPGTYLIQGVVDGQVSSVRVVRL
jgi:hypothetical protein